MRASGGKHLCQEARVYYYDLLCPEEAVVPQSVRRHVASCPVCREQIDRLRETLFETQQNPSLVGSGNEETIETLTEQFRLLDEHVTCSDAKPCLPLLAMASPQIRIPTPLTVHVDHCPQCTEDLTALRELHLTTDQLKRLGRLFRSDRGEGVPLLRSPCRAPPDERDASRAGVQGRDGDPQRDVSRLGTHALAAAAPASFSFEGDPIVCSDISPADLFDYAVPCGVTPADGNTPAEHQRVIASHVRACPVCMEKLQTLHRTIHGIMERADSETTTVYHAGNDAEDAHGRTGDAYRYGVSVQVLLGESGAAADRGDSPLARAGSARGFGRSAGSLARACSATLFGKARYAGRRMERYAGSRSGMAVIAVAAVGLAMLLRMTAPTASGTNVGDLLKTLEKAQNVHVVTMDQSDKPIQEFWIARRSNRLVNRTAQECALYDLDQDRKRTIEPQTGAIVSAKLSRIERNWARKVMTSCLGDVLERVAPNTKLHHPTSEVDTGGMEGFDLYELVLLRTRWWAYIDPVTGRPQKTEIHRQRPSEHRWGLLTTTVFTYPPEQEMNNRIQALFPAQ